MVLFKKSSFSEAVTKEDFPALKVTRNKSKQVKKTAYNIRKQDEHSQEQTKSSSLQVTGDSSSTSTSNSIGQAEACSSRLSSFDKEFPALCTNTKKSPQSVNRKQKNQKYVKEGIKPATENRDCPEKNGENHSEPNVTTHKDSKKGKPLLVDSLDSGKIKEAAGKCYSTLLKKRQGKLLNTKNKEKRETEGKRESKVQTSKHKNVKKSVENVTSTRKGTENKHESETQRTIETNSEKEIENAIIDKNKNAENQTEVQRVTEENGNKKAYHEITSDKKETERNPKNKAQKFQRRNIRKDAETQIIHTEKENKNKVLRIKEENVMGKVENEITSAKKETQNKIVNERKRVQEKNINKKTENGITETSDYLKKIESTHGNKKPLFAKEGSTDTSSSNRNAVSSNIASKKRPKRKDLMKIDLTSFLEAGKSVKQNVQKKAGKKYMTKASAISSQCGNPLDASNPIRSRGKFREHKRKKYSALRRIILEERKRKREKFLLELKHKCNIVFNETQFFSPQQSNCDNNLNIQLNDTEFFAPERSIYEGKLNLTQLNETVFFSPELSIIEDKLNLTQLNETQYFSPEQSICEDKLNLTQLNETEFVSPEQSMFEDKLTLIQLNETVFFSPEVSIIEDKLNVVKSNETVDEKNISSEVSDLKVGHETVMKISYDWEKAVLSLDKKEIHEIVTSCEGDEKVLEKVTDSSFSGEKLLDESYIKDVSESNLKVEFGDVDFDFSQLYDPNGIVVSSSDENSIQSASKNRIRDISPYGKTTHFLLQCERDPFKDLAKLCEESNWNREYVLNNSNNKEMVKKINNAELCQAKQIIKQDGEHSAEKQTVIRTLKNKLPRDVRRQGLEKTGPYSVSKEEQMLVQGDKNITSPTLLEKQNVVRSEEKVPLPVCLGKEIIEKKVTIPVNTENNSKSRTQKHFPPSSCTEKKIVTIEKQVPVQASIEKEIIEREEDRVLSPEDNLRFQESPDNSNVEKQPYFEPKPGLHSRKFREYCDHCLSPEIDSAVQNLLSELVRLQTRAYQRNPTKALMKRRYIIGLREVNKHLVDLKKIKLVIIAPDLDKIESEGGIYSIISRFKSTASSLNVPCVFALSRWKLARCVMKKHIVSCVGIADYQGCEEIVGKILESVAIARANYKLLTRSHQGDNEEIIPELNCHKKSLMSESTTSSSEDVNSEVIKSFLSKFFDNDTKLTSQSMLIGAIEKCNDDDDCNI